ncbi:MAG: hypothetical protein HYT39_03845 [Candidatus Sungbacteria bacterium]|nr:hypothetical protein [Candidatus Sungbacteria bacterium]
MNQVWLDYSLLMHRQIEIVMQIARHDLEHWKWHDVDRERAREEIVEKAKLQTEFLSNRDRLLELNVALAGFFPERAVLANG